MRDGLDRNSPPMRSSITRPRSLGYPFRHPFRHPQGYVSFLGFRLRSGGLGRGRIFQRPSIINIFLIRGRESPTYIYLGLFRALGLKEVDFFYNVPRVQNPEWMGLQKNFRRMSKGCQKITERQIYNSILLPSHPLLFFCYLFWVFTSAIFLPSVLGFHLWFYLSFLLSNIISFFLLRLLLMAWVS